MTKTKKSYQRHDHCIDTASIWVMYLLSEPEFNRHYFNFIKCTVYSKCQKNYKKTKYYVNFSAKNVQKCRNLHFYQTVQTFQYDHLMYIYGIVYIFSSKN